MILPGAWLGAVERRKGSKEATSKPLNKQQHQEQTFFPPSLKIAALRAKSDWRIRCGGVRTACLDITEGGNWGTWKCVITVFQSVLPHQRWDIHNRSMLYRYHCVNLSRNRLKSHPATPEKHLLGSSFSALELGLMTASYIDSFLQLNKGENKLFFLAPY